MNDYILDNIRKEHMIRILRVTLAAVLIGFLSGCATYTINSYGVSPKNIEIMRSLNGVMFSVNKFSASKSGFSTLQCRGSGPVRTPNNESYESYITKALISELKLANLYSESSGITINGFIQKLSFNSNIGSGKWMFIVKISDGKGTSYIVNSSFPFSTNFFGEKACQQVAQAFVPAVQTLIKDIVSNSEFNELKN